MLQLLSCYSHKFFFKNSRFLGFKLSRMVDFRVWRLLNPATFVLQLFGIKISRFLGTGAEVA
jgi:hypothetical protein